MSTFNAFEMSPVPAPSEDAQPPEPFHGIYGMPMFVTVPTSDLDASVDFWTEALGFFTLFSIPGQLVHLRRWAFQDVLLVPAPQAPAPADAQAAGMNACMGANRRATVDYAGGGSGAGRTKLVEGAVDFAGTDTPMTADEISRIGGAVELPLYLPTRSFFQTNTAVAEAPSATPPPKQFLVFFFSFTVVFS